MIKISNNIIIIISIIIVVPNNVIIVLISRSSRAKIHFVIFHLNVRVAKNTNVGVGVFVWHTIDSDGLVLEVVVEAPASHTVHSINRSISMAR